MDHPYRVLKADHLIEDVVDTYYDRERKFLPNGEIERIGLKTYRWCNGHYKYELYKETTIQSKTTSKTVLQFKWLFDALYETNHLYIGDFPDNKQWFHSLFILQIRPCL